MVPYIYHYSISLGGKVIFHPNDPTNLHRYMGRGRLELSQSQKCTTSSTSLELNFQVAFCCPDRNLRPSNARGNVLRAGVCREQRMRVASGEGVCPPTVLCIGNAYQRT